jgi:hypothetical protein
MPKLTNIQWALAAGAALLLLLWLMSGSSNKARYSIAPGGDGATYLLDTQSGDLWRVICAEPSEELMECKNPALKRVRE